MKCKNVNVKMHNKLFSIINKIEKIFTITQQIKTLLNSLAQDKKNSKSRRVDNFFKFLLFFSLFSTPLFAIEQSESILNIIGNGLKDWIPTVKSASLWVFTALTLINWVWSFGLMALSGFEFNEFLATLIKKIMYVGVFIFLFNVDYWFSILFNSFTQLATNVSGTNISPENIISNAFQILTAIWDTSTWWNIPKNLFILICGLIILIAFVFMAIDLLMVYVKFYLMNVVIYFALALGGLEHFKQIGLNPILTAIKVGVELFVIQGLMALAINSIKAALNEISANVTIDLILQTLVMSLIFAVITKLVPTVIEAVFSGSIGDSSGAASGFKAVAAMMGGMAAGAVAGSIGTTRAIAAARSLDIAEGGKGGLGGIAKNLLQTGGEHLKENFVHGRAPNDVANRLQTKKATIQKGDGTIGSGSNTGGGDTPKNESYVSGVGTAEK